MSTFTVKAERWSKRPRFRRPPAQSRTSRVHVRVYWPFGRTPPKGLNVRMFFLSPTIKGWPGTRAKAESRMFTSEVKPLNALLGSRTELASRVSENLIWMIPSTSLRSLRTSCPLVGSVCWTSKSVATSGSLLPLPPPPHPKMKSRPRDRPSKRGFRVSAVIASLRE